MRLGAKIRRDDTVEVVSQVAENLARLRNVAQLKQSHLVLGNLLIGSHV